MPTIRHRPVLAIGLVLALAVSAAPLPAVAAPFCNGGGNGLHIEMEFGFGDRMTEADQASFDLMKLRRRGVDATRVERWNGCLRAWVRQPEGGETMEFYDPLTLRPVE